MIRARQRREARAERSGGDRRRPGRFRRWVLRPFLWGLAALAAALLAAALFVRSDTARERARTLIATRLAEFLDREVEIGEVRFSLVPITLEVQDLIVGPGAPGEPPLAVVPRLRVLADLAGLRRPVLTLRRVEIEQPQVVLLFRDDGTSNLPEIERRDGEPGRLEVVIGALSVVGGEVGIDHRRVPLEMEARGVRASLVGTGGVSLQGQAVGQEVRVTLPRARPYVGTLAVRLSSSPGRVDLMAGKIAGPDLSANLSGSFVWGERQSLDLRVVAAGSAGLLYGLGYLEEPGIAGRFRFDGGLAWRPEAWGFRGAVTSPRLDLLGYRVGDLSGLLVGDRNGVRFDIERAAYGGGRLEGGITVDVDGEAPPVEVDLSFRGVAVDRLLADLEIPLEGLAGRAEGVVNYRFTTAAPKDGDGWADVAIAAGRVGPGELPLRGTAPLVIENGVIGAEPIRLVAGAQRVAAAGSFDLETRRGRFEYRIESGWLPELALLLPPPDPADPPPAWIPTAGRGLIRGTLLLGPDAVVSEMALDLDEVVAPGAHAERLWGDLRVSRQGIEGLRLELSAPGAEADEETEGAVMVRGRIPFPPEEGGPPASFELDLAVDAVSWPMADARAWLPVELPLDGRFSGMVRLHGDPENPEGRVAGHIPDARWEEAELGRVDARLAFGRESLTVEELRVSAEAGEITASGSLGRVDEALDLRLASTALDLAAAPFDELVPGGLEGRAILEAELGGTMSAPVLRARLEAEELALAGRPLGEEGRAALGVLWQGGELAAEGSLLGLMRFEGGGALDLEQGAELEFAVASSDLRGLLQLASEAPVGELIGVAEGTLRVTGPPRDPERLAARLVLDRLEASYAGHRLENLEPVAVSLASDALVIESFFVGEEEHGSELFVAGRVGFDEEIPLDLRLQSTLDLAWLELLVPGIEARGHLDALASIGGTASAPDVNGQGEVRGARLIVQGLPQSFEEVTGTLLFYPDQVVVDSLAAEFAGGVVRVGGSIQLDGGEGEMVSSYRLQVSGRDLSLRYPEGWLLRGSGELVFASAEAGRQIRGVVELERAYYLRDVELGLTQLLRRFFQRQRIQVEETDELLASTQINLVVQGQDALRVRNNLANLRGDIDLTVRGSLARPVVFGEVELEPGGTLVYSEIEYQVDRGLLTFANPYRLEPVVDLVATADVREFDVTLNLSGPLDRLNATFTADPTLPDLEILALLTTGEPLARGGVYVPGEGGDRGLGAEGFLYGQAASLVSQRVNTLFGLDKFKIDPLTESSGDLSGTRVTVGKQISKDLFATYSFDPSESDQQILQVEWKVSQELAVVLTQNGEEDSYAVDLRWERRF